MLPWRPRACYGVGYVPASMPAHEISQIRSFHKHDSATLACCGDRRAHRQAYQ